MPRLDNLHLHGFTKMTLSSVVTILGLLIIGGGLIIWHAHRPSGGTTVVLAQTYCSSTGKICFSYPKSWRLNVDKASQAGIQAIVTDPATKTSVQYSPQLVTVEDACAPRACLFKTLSVVISNGFANADDVAGVFQSKGNGFTPEYFLVATRQLQQMGFSVGATIDVQMFDLYAGFVNGSLTKLYQGLEVVSPSSMSFASVTAAENWLSSPVARTAAAIVNSARPQS